MSEETKLSNRARKKLERQGQSPATARSESGASDAPKKDDAIANLDVPTGDSDFKPREGPSPFIDVVSKKIRNLNKRRVCFSPPFTCNWLIKNFRLDLKVSMLRRRILMPHHSFQSKLRLYLFFLKSLLLSMNCRNFSQFSRDWTDLTTSSLHPSIANTKLSCVRLNDRRKRLSKRPMRRDCRMDELRPNSFVVF
jgi:hypothetical protein